MNGERFTGLLERLDRGMEEDISAERCSMGHMQARQPMHRVTAGGVVQDAR